MTRKAISILTIKAVKEDQRIIEGMATTPTPDRVGDIVDPMGAEFPETMPLLWMHRHDLPVGTVKFGKPTEEGIPFTASIPTVSEPSGLKARLDEAWMSVKLRLVAAVSIGFRALEYSVIDSTGGLRFTRTEIYELSLVTVPANAEATIETIKGLINNSAAGDGKAAQFVAKSVMSAGTAAQPATKVVKINNVQSKDDNMDINAQIKGFEDTVRVKLKAMEDMVAASEGETLSAEKQAEYDEMQAEVESAGEHIKRLQKLVQLKGAAATPITEAAGNSSKTAADARAGHVQVKAAEKLDKGIEFARYAMCLTAAKGDKRMALDLAKQHYGQNERIIKALDFESRGGNLANVMKANVQAGSTITGAGATWGSELVDYETFTGDFIEYLRPKTIVGRFGTNGIPALRAIPFNVKIKGQNTGGAAYWVGEGKPKPLTQFGFMDVELGFTKIASIAVLTEDLIRFSNPSAERLVRDALADAVIARADEDFIDPAKAAVAGVSPASITNGVTAITSSGNDAEAIRNDVRALWATFIAANNAPSNAVYIMSTLTALALSMLQNPLGQSEFEGLTMNGGTFMGVPVIVSDYVTADTAGSMVILANASDIYLADDGQVVIDASREASLQMLDNPTNDSVTPTATQMVSMFQTNSVAIRAERYINWSKRRASAVAVLTGVNWGAPQA